MRDSDRPSRQIDFLGGGEEARSMQVVGGWPRWAFAAAKEQRADLSPCLQLAERFPRANLF